MLSRPIALIADDDAATRRVLTDFLRLLGFEPEAFDDGEGLVAAVLRAPPALIVTDENMRRCNGTRALGRIRTSGADCPAIVLSAWPDDALRARTQALQPCNLLAKPVDLSELRGTILRLTG